MKIVFTDQFMLIKCPVILFGILLLLQSQQLQAQVVSTSGAYISVTSGTVVVTGTIIPDATTTLANSGTINFNTLTNNGTVSGNGTYNLSGDFTNNLTFTAGTGTVTLNGTSAQSIGGSAATTFYNLTNANTSAEVTAGNHITVSSQLDLNSGSVFGIASNTLTLNGTITGTGNLRGTASAGSSTSNLVIGGTVGTLNFDQTTAATRSLNNLTLNSSSSATLGNALDVYGTITATSATLHLASKNLTLKSNATNTARIADLNSSTLDGADNVTVERYIPQRPGLGRAYRFLASTVNTGTSLRTNWMEGGLVTTVGGSSDPVPNYGTHITGSGGNSNNFDVTQTNQSSIYTTANGGTSSTLVYTAVANASGTMSATQGYFLFVRGNRSESLSLPTTPGMSTSATTLRTTGTLLTGTQTSFGTMVGGAGSLNQVTNPYASPIDWSLVQPACSNIGTSYTFWDPRNGTRGGFVTVNTAGVPSSGAANQYIQPGQAFFVEASGASAPTISIQESHKTAGNNNNVFRPSVLFESFRTELYFTEPSSFRRLADGAIALYDNNYSAGIDIYDAGEINNWDENIAIARNGKHLAIEARPVIITRDTLPLFINNMKQRDYEFEFTPSLFTNIGLKAELVDNFTATRTVLSVTSASVVPFTVTSNPASSSNNRFMVVFGPQTPLAVSDITIKATRNTNGIRVEWTSSSETDMDHYEVERSAGGSIFSRIKTETAVGNSSIPVNYSWLDVNPFMGNAQHPADNFYRVKGVDRSGNYKYSPVVKVLYGKNDAGIVVYPNPVNGNSFSIDLNNLAKGIYYLGLINNLGQEVFSESVHHDGSSSAKTITWKRELPTGVYQLVLKGDNGIRLTQKMIKN